MLFYRRVFSIICVICCCILFISREGIAEEETEVYYLSEGESLATGKRVYLQKPEISIETIQNWMIAHHPAAGVTFQLTAPEQVKHLKHSTIRFSPSLNIRTIYSSEPIDSVREASFQEELMQQFSQITPLQDFRILETQRTTIKEHNDALVVFAGFISSQFPMLQIHTLVASQKEQYILTYTDFHEILEQKPERLEQIWQVIGSLDFQGTPAGRYDHIFLALIVMIGLFISCFLLMFIRRSKQSKKLQRILDEKFDLDDNDIHSQKHPAKSDLTDSVVIDLGFA